jgi:hypothetical protein
VTPDSPGAISVAEIEDDLVRLLLGEPRRSTGSLHLERHLERMAVRDTVRLDRGRRPRLESSEGDRDVVVLDGKEPGAVLGP